MTNIDIKEDKVIYSNDLDVTYNVYKNAKLVLFNYVIDESSNICVNLLENDASVEYHYSSINHKNNVLNVNINHLSSNTTSNIYNHGVNFDDNLLKFNVTSKIIKESSNCICNQENQIINLKDGKGEINPNLLIDNYDTVSSHAAYIGKFKEENIFYLMSRGINRKLAINMLIKTLLLNNGEENDLVKEYLDKLKEEVNNG